MILTEAVIRQIIKEELGICSEIVTETCRIAELIKNELIMHHLAKGIYTVKTDFLERKLVLTISNKQNVSDDELNAYSSYMGKLNFITLDVCSKNGQINTKMLFNLLQHELTHIYQQIVTDKNLPTNEIKYNFVNTYINNNDIYLKTIAKVVYYSFKFEQEGFCNGLYAEYKQMADKNEGLKLSINYYALKETDTFKVIEDFEECISTIKTYNTDIINKVNIVLKTFGLTFSKILKDADIAERNFKKRLGRILVKLKNDFEKEGFKTLNNERLWK